MKDKELRARLAKSLEEDVLVIDTTDNTFNYNTAVEVMRAYQNANKWLDIIKETVLMDMGCVFFSNYIHQLAHTMPVRFDKFGDILHTINTKIPYPDTAYIVSEPADISAVFNQVYGILDAISSSLTSFVTESESHNLKGAAIAAEELITDIEKEYTSLHHMQRAYDMCNDNIKFDKWLQQYISNITNLI